MAGEVQDQGRPHGLTSQGAAAAPGQQGCAVAGCDAHRGLDVLLVLGDDHPQGLDLVVAGVGAVEHAAVAVKTHRSPDGPFQLLGQLPELLGDALHLLEAQGRA